jgi:hypothetical protein
VIVVNSRRSDANSDPVLPRPWKRIKVCVWAMVGRIMWGSEWVAIFGYEIL